MSRVLATEGPKTLDFWLVTGVAPLPDYKEKRKKRIDEPATPRIGGSALSSLVRPLSGVNRLSHLYLSRVSDL